MNYTPGPWRVTHHGIKMIKVENKDRVIFDGFHGEEANAKLAASAPDMLSALVMAKNWMSVEGDYGKDQWEEHDQAIYDDIMETIDNAIKKAT
jgi:hypothetical protein